VGQYPSLALAEVYAVIGYYLQRQAEVEAYLSQRRQFASEVRRQNEARFNQQGIRERLLARRSQPGTVDDAPTGGSYLPEFPRILASNWESIPPKLG
jgi:hypothetical protein